VTDAVRNFANASGTIIRRERILNVRFVGYLNTSKYLQSTMQFITYRLHLQHHPDSLLLSFSYSLLKDTLLSWYHQCHMLAVHTRGDFRLRGGQPLPLLPRLITRGPPTQLFARNSHCNT
jgi:hypothetical protein